MVAKHELYALCLLELVRFAKWNNLNISSRFSSHHLPAGREAGRSTNSAHVLAALPVVNSSLFIEQPPKIDE